MKKIGKGKVGCVVLVIWLTLIVLYLVGYVKCIIKAVDCDWETPYKAEIIYTAGSCSGLGGIIGWLDIKDGKKPETQN